MGVVWAVDQDDGFPSRPWTRKWTLISRPWTRTLGWLFWANDSDSGSVWPVGIYAA